MSDWIHNSRPAVTWVSLDESDSDPARFWAYVVAALQTQEPALGREARLVLQLPQTSPIEPLLTRLINEIATSADTEGDRTYVLVLDDYHVIGEQQIHDALGFLLDHLPPNLHLVIS